MQYNLRMTTHPVLDIKRGGRVSFQFNGKKMAAYEGETMAAALYASGVRIFSRSFKYHRPRGLFCMSGHCSNCLMRVNGVPNVRICREPVRSNALVESQNAWPCLNFDLAVIINYLHFLFRPGFQYKRFIRPRWAYHLWEKCIRRMAGIGTLADNKPARPAIRRKMAAEIVVVGGGIAGLSAAIHAAQAVSEVWLVEKEIRLGGRGLYDTSYIQTPEGDELQHKFVYIEKLIARIEEFDNIHIIKNATAFAWYDEGILAVSQPHLVWELSPSRAIIATGSYETPMVFGNNDLPGIFSVDGLQRLMHADYVRPGDCAAVVTHNNEGYAIANQLIDAGVKVAGIIDKRGKDEISTHPETQDIRDRKIAWFPGHEIKAATGSRRITGITIQPVISSGKNNPQKTTMLSCDTLCIAGARIPANELAFQRTCEGAYILESPHQFTRRPIISEFMQAGTDLYVADEASGSFGVKRNWLEGKIAGLSAVIDLGHGAADVKSDRDEALWHLADET